MGDKIESGVRSVKDKFKSFWKKKDKKEETAEAEAEEEGGALDHQPEEQKN
jgi:hypothetical protein